MSCITGNGRMFASLQLDTAIKEIQDLLTIKKIQMWKEITVVIHSSLLSDDTEANPRLVTN